jgi:hypothetical protein
MGKITVLACGGLGINIGQKIETEANGDNVGNEKYADLGVFYADTSEANLKKFGIQANADNVYLFDGIDGSGSLRAKNAASITDAVRDILIRVPKSDLYIVLNSMGGGSGSVIGPSLVSELLGRGDNVVVMTTQVSDVVKRLENTVRTFETYESIAKKRQRVLPIMLCDNGEEPESVVNKTFTMGARMLSILYSGENDRLDSADLDHWINYNKVTSHPVGAVLLDICFGKNFETKHQVCSVATLAENPDVDTRFNHMVEYQAVGFMMEGVEKDMEPVHFVLVDGPIQAAYHSKHAMWSEARKRAESVKTRVDISSDAAQDNGLVL